MINKIVDYIYLGSLEDSLNFNIEDTPVQSKISVCGWNIEKDIIDGNSSTLWKMYRMLAENIPSQIPTLVYCDGGIDRSPFVVAWFLRQFTSMSEHEAYELVQFKHSQTIVHDDWMRIFCEVD